MPHAVIIVALLTPIGNLRSAFLLHISFFGNFSIGFKKDAFSQG
jgi:hypothetical protein